MLSQLKNTMFFVAKICKNALRASTEGNLAVAASTPTYSSLALTQIYFWTWALYEKHHTMMKDSKLWKWICCNVVSDKLKIITHQRQMQHHVAIQWDWIGWISGLSYRAPTVLIIWNWYLVYFLKWYFEAGKAGEEKACQGCRPDVKGLQLAVDGKQFGDQTPDQMKIIS